MRSRTFVNSLLGLLVLPRARILGDLPQVPIDDTGVPTWHVSFMLTRSLASTPTKLRQLVRGMRNSVAHSSMEFTSDGRDITGITFVNMDAENDQELWRATFDLEQLRGFLGHLADEVERACKRSMLTS